MYDILHRVGINAGPEKVFNALTTIEGLRGWWSSTASGDATRGGLINYGFCDLQVWLPRLTSWCTGAAHAVPRRGSIPRSSFGSNGRKTRHSRFSNTPRGQRFC